MKLNENIGKPNELWKPLNSLGLPSKNKSGSKICLNKNGKLNFEPKVNTNIFKNFFSNLEDDLLKKLPNLKNKFNMDSIKSDYGKPFSFSHIDEEIILKLLQEMNPPKATGIDGLTGKFLKHGTQLCNLSISLSTFPEKYKIAKLKPLQWVLGQKI